MYLFEAEHLRHHWNPMENEQLLESSILSPREMCLDGVPLTVAENSELQRLVHNFKEQYNPDVLIIATGIDPNELTTEKTDSLWHPQSLLVQGEIEKHLPPDKVAVLDDYIAYLPSAVIAKIIESLEVKIVLFGMTGKSTDKARAIQRLVKQASPSIFTIAGGVHVTSLAKEFKEINEFDAIWSGTAHGLGDFVEKTLRGHKLAPPEIRTYEPETRDLSLGSLHMWINFRRNNRTSDSDVVCVSNIHGCTRKCPFCKTSSGYVSMFDPIMMRDHILTLLDTQYLNRTEENPLRIFFTGADSLSTEAISQLTQIARALGTQGKKIVSGGFATVQSALAAKDSDLLYLKSVLGFGSVYLGSETTRPQMAVRLRKPFGQNLPQKTMEAISKLEKLDMRVVHGVIPKRHDTRLEEFFEDVLGWEMVISKQEKGYITWHDLCNMERAQPGDPYEAEVEKANATLELSRDTLRFTEYRFLDPKMELMQYLMSETEIFNLVVGFQERVERKQVYSEISSYPKRLKKLSFLLFELVKNLYAAVEAIDVSPYDFSSPKNVKQMHDLLNVIVSENSLLITNKIKENIKDFLV